MVFLLFLWTHLCMHLKIWFVSRESVYPCILCIEPENIICQNSRNL